MERLIDRAMVAVGGCALGGILMKFLYAMWLCSLFMRQVEGVTQGAVLRGWIL